jgi:Ras-related C3 botulinum toxin substrate 1
MKSARCVLVGGEDRDRVALILTYTGKFPDDIPATCDNVDRNFMVEDVQVNLQLLNTASHPDYKKLRPLSYVDTDLFILCFSLVSPSSLEAIQKEWVPEVKEHCPNVPYILVGLLSDARDSFEKHAEAYRKKGWEPVPTAKGEEMKEAIGAQAYVECSAKREYNVKEVFDTAVKTVLHPPPPESEPDSGKKKKKDCQIA